MEGGIAVTIGIPVYNAGKYLKKAIDSVLAQTFMDLEIIISIDGSSDDSSTIVNCYKDPRIHVIAEKDNRGIAYRLNEQVKLAKGEYFARMDADDVMFPYRIERQLKFMKENSDIDVIGSQALVINENNKIIGYRKSDQNFTRETILKKTLFIHPTVFGKTSWFQNNPYSSEFDGVEDFYLWNSTFSATKFHVMNEPLLFYRDPPNLNVGTYLKRQKQIRKALCKLSGLSVISKTGYCKLLLFSYVKTAIYYTFGNLNISNIIVKKRNRSLTEDEVITFSEILRNSIGQNI